MLRRMVERFVESRREMGSNGGSEGVIAQLPALKHFDGTDILKSISCEEVMIMHGGEMRTRELFGFCRLSCF